MAVEADAEKREEAVAVEKRVAEAAAERNGDGEGRHQEEVGPQRGNGEELPQGRPPPRRRRRPPRQRGVLPKMRRRGSRSRQRPPK